MRNHKIAILVSVCAVGIFLFSYFFVVPIFSVNYKSSDYEGVVSSMSTTTVKDAKETKSTQALLIKPNIEEIVVTHVKTPSAVKAIYVSACVASMPSWRTKLADMIASTELNSMVIDVKDFTGSISYYPTDPKLNEVKGTGCRVKDMKSFVAELHEKGIYVIARITTFQDPAYTKAHPELAVKRASDGGVWKDHKGLAFIDVSAKPYWDYVALLARDTYALGFDEINFDYIRFPSDGNMKDIAYPWTGTLAKATALENFFVYLEKNVKPSGAIISADLFGMTTVNTDDLGIGQVLEPALRHFDYVAPMVYPSHYPPHFNGWLDPNKHVYDVVYYSMSRAVKRAVSMVTPPVVTPTATTTKEVTTTVATLLTPEEKAMTLKLRPWLQDFNYGGTYGPIEVRAQIKATYDSGLASWMLWDPANKYTPSALLAS